MHAQECCRGSCRADLPISFSRCSSSEFFLSFCRLPLRPSEVLSSMKVVKLQAWEESFIERIMALREQELHHLLNYIIAQALSFMLWSAVPLAVAVATFGAYVASGNNLDVATALTSLALFDILRFPLFMLPQIINNMVEAGVSLGRVRSFLLGEDHQSVGPGDLSEMGILMLNLSAAYESLKPNSSDENQSDPLLKELEEKKWELTLLQSQLDEAENRIKELLSSPNLGKTASGQGGGDDDDAINCTSASMLCLKRVDFECKPGQLIAVVGGVGCGKSSLLNGMLGELRYLYGTNSVNADRLAYFSQTPFILNATVRDNILFGHVNEPVDEERYQRALQSCALSRDLKILPAGDLTEIGEKGITLSGGQKARVALGVYQIRCLPPSVDAGNDLMRWFAELVVESYCCSLLENLLQKCLVVVQSPRMITNDRFSPKFLFRLMRYCYT